MHSNGNSGNKQANVWKGLAAGAIGGIVASWVMDEFQSAWMKVSTSREAQNGSAEKKKDESDEPATIKAAEKVSETFFGRMLAERDKHWAGNAVHYGLT